MLLPSRYNFINKHLNFKKMNSILRKQIVRISNKTIDEFLQRVVKASDSLKNNAFAKYVSNLKTSAKTFNELRFSSSGSDYTPQMREVALKADNDFKRIRLTVEFSMFCKTAQEQTDAVELNSVLKKFGNIAHVGILKKFADYEALVSQLKPLSKKLTTLGLDTTVTDLEKLIVKFRELNIGRDGYRLGLKGKRFQAKEKAWEDYLSLRDYVEAFTVINGDKETSAFVGYVNEAIIYLAPNESKKQA